VGIRAVFFDAGETLVHPVPSFPELFARTVTREGHPRTAEQIADGLSMVSDEFARAAVEEELWTTHPDRSRTFWIRVYERFLDALDIPDANGLTDTLYATFTALENYDAFDDVRPALDRLRGSGRGLGVISNFEPWLEDLLVRLELDSVLTVRVISGVEGVEKPDLSIFRLALDRAGLAASESAYVGDIPAFDIAPSAELGMFPVLIDRRGRHEGFDGPGVRITSLDDLPEVLDG
jgi:putative hydrolase of the HAD superfamily